MQDLVFRVYDDVLCLATGVKNEGDVLPDKLSIEDLLTMPREMALTILSKLSLPDIALLCKESYAFARLVCAYGHEPGTRARDLEEEATMKSFRGRHYFWELWESFLQRDFGLSTDIAKCAARVTPARELVVASMRRFYADKVTGTDGARLSYWEKTRNLRQLYQDIYLLGRAPNRKTQGATVFSYEDGVVLIWSTATKKFGFACVVDLVSEAPPKLIAPKAKLAISPPFGGGSKWSLYPSRAAVSGTANVYLTDRGRDPVRVAIPQNSATQRLQTLAADGTTIVHVDSDGLRMIPIGDDEFVVLQGAPFAINANEVGAPVTVSATFSVFAKSSGNYTEFTVIANDESLSRRVFTSMSPYPSSFGPGPVVTYYDYRSQTSMSFVVAQMGRKESGVEYRCFVFSHSLPRPIEESEGVEFLVTVPMAIINARVGHRFVLLECIDHQFSLGSVQADNYTYVRVDLETGRTYEETHSTSESVVFGTDANVVRTKRNPNRNVRVKPLYPGRYSYLQARNE